MSIANQEDSEIMKRHTKFREKKKKRFFPLLVYTMYSPFYNTMQRIVSGIQPSLLWLIFLENAMK